MTLHHAPSAPEVTHTTEIDAAGPAPLGRSRPARRHWGGPVVGGFFLTMGGVHVGLVSADTEVYRRFADAALFGFVRDGWQDVFMAQPAFFGMLLAVGEITLGVLLLRGGRAATVGWAGVVAFHLLLMLFGFGIWVWCLPALALLVLLARRDQALSTPRFMADRRSAEAGRVLTDALTSGDAGPRETT